MMLSVIEKKNHTQKTISSGKQLSTIYLEGFINDLLCGSLDCHKLWLLSSRQGVVVSDWRQCLTATKIKRFH